MPEIQPPSQQNLSGSNHHVAAEPVDSELLQCSICVHKFDCDSRPQVPLVLPGCGHTFCAGCIDELTARAQRESFDSFACPVCNCRQPIGEPCPTNWWLKTHIASLRKVKRRRPAALPPAQDAEAPTCHRHVNAAAEVLCIDCGELTCIRCAFECAQNQHKCVKADALQLSATGSSSAAIDAAFERGKQKIRARLDEEIRASQAAAARLHLRLAELCECTKLTQDQDFKNKIQNALSHKDARGLCKLLQDGHGPAFDFNIQENEIILRCHRKVSYENGTVYEGFVDVATGLADGEGSVTWGPSAGRSSRRAYSGQFTAGRTAERVKFTWKEKRAGQIGVGSHAYNGTVEVSRCCGVFFAFLVLFIFSSCGALLMHAAQVETGAWSGQASIQYDVSEVRTQIFFTELPFANNSSSGR